MAELSNQRTKIMAAAAGTGHINKLKLKDFQKQEPDGPPMNSSNMVLCIYWGRLPKL